MAYKGINDLIDWLQDRRIFGDPDARHLIQALEDLDDHVREATRAGSDPDLDLSALRRIAAGAGSDVRKLAVVALARFGDAAASEQVTDLIDDPLPAIRETASETLATTDQQPAQPATQQADQEQHPAPGEPAPPRSEPTEVPAQPTKAPHPTEQVQAQQAKQSKGTARPTHAKRPPAEVRAPRAPRHAGPAPRRPAPRPAPSTDTASEPQAAERQRLLALIRQTAAELNSAEHETPRGISLTVPLPGGQKQDVTFSVEHDDDEQLDLIRISAPCGPADSGNYRKALLVNQHLTFGAITLVEGGPGRSTFALVALLPADEASTKTLRRRTAYIADVANKFARQLSGR
ncbi:MAG TPA: hypothetical protein VM223_10335 [Planctomycetota bacterium]|nr:hypothetical protein [Planctomycetota bacterium]